MTDLARHLQTVREDERSHLARELHDELGGLLTAAKLDLARMRSRLVQAGPEVAERVTHLHATLDAGIALKRRIIEDLRPSSLDNLGLSPALRILCHEWSAASEIPVEVELEEMSLSAEGSLVVYRLVQEALTNVAKYAHARRVSVKLAMAETEGQALVLVQDNGRGFAAAQRTPGHGLAGMRFRVASIGGELTVDSAPGRGTTIKARLPLQDGDGLTDRRRPGRAGAGIYGRAVTLTCTVKPAKSLFSPNQAPANGTTSAASRPTATRMRSCPPMRLLVGSAGNQPQSGR